MCFLMVKYRKNIYLHSRTTISWRFLGSFFLTRKFSSVFNPFRDGFDLV